MQTFIRIVEARSISKAAEQLGLAKSGVSRRLAELEDQLGVRLMNRTTRRISLTEAGRAYYEGAVRLLGDVEELNASTSDSDTSLSGTLRLGVPLSFGLCHLTSAIDEFLVTHPGLNLHVDFSDRKIDLLEQGIDLAIRIADLADSSLQARRICPIRLVLCASPDYLEEHGAPQHPEDLKHHRVLHYDAGGRPQMDLRDRGGNRYLVPVEAPISANNGDFLRDMALAGHGMILAPSFITWQSLASGDLVRVLPEYRPPRLNAYAVYPQTRYLSRRARLFIDFLAERFGENPYWDAPASPGGCARPEAGVSLRR